MVNSIFIFIYLHLTEFKLSKVNSFYQFENITSLHSSIFVTSGHLSVYIGSVHSWNDILNPCVSDGSIATVLSKFYIH